jgi:ABC-type antimicrobial peptide transport system permease subunit
VATALKQVERLAPSASAQNLTDGAASFLQQVRSFTDLLLAISLLSLLAGVIIVANSVALAMLERQREVGILKTVGYTARGILGQIVLENALVGGVGAFCATLLAASGVVAFSKVFFNNNLILSMEPAVTIALIVGPVLLACATATLVAWRAARVRPLIVLRYE